MTTQTAPTFASRGGHDDKLSTVHIPDPRSRAEEPLSPADRLRLAEGEARDATARAEAAEAEGARNRAVAQEASREAKRASEAAEAAERRWQEDAARQVMTLEDQLRKLMAAKVAAPEVDPITRAHARTFLHGLGVGDDGGLTVVAVLRRADNHLAQLFRIHEAAGKNLGIADRHASDALFGKLDTLECACWREILRRVQLIAGEVEDPA